MELNNLKDLVTDLLQKNKNLRGSDDLLYLSVIRNIYPYWNNGSVTTNIQNISIGEFFTSRKSLNLPTFESVTRCRRKVQEENPALKPCEEIQKGREKQEEKFYDFSKLKQQSFDF